MIRAALVSFLLLLAGCDNTPDRHLLVEIISCEGGAISAKTSEGELLVWTSHPGFPAEANRLYGFAKPSKFAWVTVSGAEIQSFDRWFLSKPPELY